MLRFCWLGLLAPAGSGCAPELALAEGSPAFEVDDFRDGSAPVAMDREQAELWQRASDSAEWRGDTLTVDSRCLLLRRHRGSTLDEVCDEVYGGTAFVGEDRIAATVFDDAGCLVAAGYLPEPGGDGSAVVPGGGLGLIIRCAILAEPR